MSTLLYRGKTYEPHHEPAPKACRELQYHRQHYNTCREEAKRAAHPLMNYRGINYIKDVPQTADTSAESRMRNDRQAYLAMARDLADAQFARADAELSRRLWQEVGDRNMDVERLTHLLYGCWFQDDVDAMRDADAEYLATHP
ncbi:MAG: DUF4278 domain-containing protein [Synechococcus sp.]|nr:DUF4278 domain-containing protein [Synechococcus sp.]